MRLGFSAFLVLLLASFSFASPVFNGPSVSAQPEENVACCLQLLSCFESDDIPAISIAEPVQALPVCFVIRVIEQPSSSGANIFGSSGHRASEFSASSIEALYEDLEVRLDYLSFWIDRLEYHQGLRRQY